MQRYKGLVAAPFTPFKTDGTLNLPMIGQLALSLANNQVTGAFICGTTGESASLTTLERMQIAEQWQKLAPDNLKVIVHVGHTALEESCELAAHAQKTGVDAVGCMAPYFFKPQRAEELVEYLGKVAAAAPDLPFYYYHIPCITGVHVLASDFLRYAADQIPNLAGIKFTDENLMDYLACVQFENSRFDILFGRDELLLAGLALGAKGAIGSTYNYMAPVYHRIIAAFNAGNLEEAQKSQSLANASIALLLKFGGSPAIGKLFMQLIGLDCGSARLPLPQPPQEVVGQLHEELTAAGFYTIANKATNKCF